MPLAACGARCLAVCVLRGRNGVRKEPDRLFEAGKRRLRKKVSLRKKFLLHRLKIDSICATSDANARASGEVGKQDLHPRGYVATVTSLKELSGLRRINRNGRVYWR